MLSVWKYILNIFWVFQTSYLFFNELLPFGFLTVNICNVMNAWPLNSWKKIDREIIIKRKKHIITTGAFSIKQYFIFQIDAELDSFNESI